MEINLPNAHIYIGSVGIIIGYNDIELITGKRPQDVDFPYADYKAVFFFDPKSWKFCYMSRHIQWKEFETDSPL